MASVAISGDNSQPVKGYTTLYTKAAPVPRPINVHILELRVTRADGSRGGCQRAWLRLVVRVPGGVLRVRDRHAVVHVIAVRFNFAHD